MPDSIKHNLEFQINSSVNILFNWMSNSSRLAVWFTDDVIIKDKIYSFFWDGYSNDSKILKKDNQFIRFKWVNNEKTESYFNSKYRLKTLHNI